MTLADLHPTDKALSVKPLELQAGSRSVSLQFQAGAVLAKHTTPVPAVLICVSGEVLYRLADAPEVILRSGDFVNIPVLVLHEVVATSLSQLLLIK